MTKVEALIMEEGIELGVERGREEGIKCGREEGIKRGREEGIERGMERGKEAIVANLLRLGNLDDQDILKASGFSKKRLNKIKKEIQLE